MNSKDHRNIVKNIVVKNIGFFYRARKCLSNKCFISAKSVLVSKERYKKLKNHQFPKLAIRTIYGEN